MNETPHMSGTPQGDSNLRVVHQFEKALLIATFSI
jgi:hypothetical protein